MRRILLASFLALGALLVRQQPAAAQRVCFPDAQDVPRCVADPLGGYWGGNGGLPVFGYPLTELRPEYNADLNQLIATQWMERYRLERHPQNRAPYTILLGRIGAERLEQLGRNPAAEGREAWPLSGCLWFEETGHNVCDQAGQPGFKTYWESHGLQIDGLTDYERSLQLFGLPLTAPRVETNSSGDTVLTQWFERARFEWHPDNPDEFKVLLGRLAAEVRAPSDSAPRSIFGLEVLPRSVLKTADQAAAANPSLTRYNGVVWSEIEAEQGRRNWGAMASREADLKILAERDLSPMLIIRGTPAWAQATPGSSCGPIKPEALDEFADFVTATVRRYSAPPYNIKYWEFWNEPDIDPSTVAADSVFGCYGDQGDPDFGGGAYAEMLKRAYPAVKQADPQAVVVSGGLWLGCDPTLKNQAKPCLTGRFLEGFLKNGGGDAVDVIAYHAYTYWDTDIKDWNIETPGWDHRGGVLLGKLDLVRDTMHAYGVRKPILMNEGGLLCWRSSPACQVPAFYDAQANQLVRMFARSWANGLWGSVWYTLDGPGWQESGLLDAKQAPRPGYTTFKLLATLLEDASYECPLGRNSLEGYAFRKGATTYLIYWTNDSRQVSVSLPKTTRAIFDKSGATRPVSGSAISVGFEPIIIEAAELACGQ
ncbi:MAG TPA: hypothetical protein VD886_00325 [Herpetosiphonaceae bacterium]|nr:hypothetical protein [Herpetosiphonaceae bacterium]